MGKEGGEDVLSQGVLRVQQMEGGAYGATRCLWSLCGIPFLVGYQDEDELLNLTVTGTRTPSTMNLYTTQDLTEKSHN